MPEPWTCPTPTVLRMQGQPRYKRPGFDRGELARCRPEARRLPMTSRYAAGPLQCVPLKRWLQHAVWIANHEGRYPRGRPPCSAAPHRLLAMGYFDIAF